MAAAEIRAFLDGVQAGETQLDLFDSIRVDQAIGMAAEAELEIALGLDSAGNWSGIGEDFALPFHRIRVEVRVGEADFVALIDGPVVGTKYELSATPNSSRMTVVVQDDSILLNREEVVERYENKRPDEIVSQIFQDHGLEADVDTVNLPAGGLEREIVLRGTAMHLLRDLGRRHGCFVYVRAGEEVGKSVGVFKRPDLGASDSPEILLLGSGRNVNALEIEFDALKPAVAQAAAVSVPNLKVSDSVVDASSQTALGEEASHSLTEAGTILLSRVREEAEDIDAALQSTVDHSSWAFSAQGEVSAGSYSGVLEPHKLVGVAGASAQLSGDYLISRVTHTIDDTGYRQEFQLRRNAGSASSSDNALAGIF